MATPHSHVLSEGLVWFGFVYFSLASIVLAGRLVMVAD
jgi:hypothetical protein